MQIQECNETYTKANLLQRIDETCTISMTLIHSIIPCSRVEQLFPRKSIDFGKKCCHQWELPF